MVCIYKKIQKGWGWWKISLVFNILLWLQNCFDFIIILNWLINTCQLLDDYAADKEMSVRQMISSRRWSGYLRRLAVCADEKCFHFTAGSGSLAASLLTGDCLGNLAGDNDGLSASSKAIFYKPNPVSVVNHSCEGEVTGKQEKCQEKNAGCIMSREACCLAGRNSQSATARFPLTSTSPAEVRNPNIGYLQALVGGLQWCTRLWPCVPSECPAPSCTELLTCKAANPKKLPLNSDSCLN